LISFFFIITGLHTSLATIFASLEKRY